MTFIILIKSETVVRKYIWMGDLFCGTRKERKKTGRYGLYKIWATGVLQRIRQ